MRPVLLRHCVLTLLASAATAQTPAARLDSALAARFAAGGPGAVMLVVKDGREMYRGGRGLADLGARVPLTARTPIYIASITKEFTALGILRLAEQGRLGCDDLVSRHLPELGAWAAGITLRQLLDHTSGLPDHLEAMHDSVTGWTNADVLAFLQRYGRLDAAPGQRTSYSNSGYVLLAMVIERVAGVSYPQFLQREFLGPLGLSGTGVITRDVPAPGPLAMGYQREGDRWVARPYDAFTYGAGGMYSTLEDLRRWAEAILAGRVVSDTMLRLASTPRASGDGRPSAYGLGWLAEFEERGPLANVWYVASTGSFKGYQGLVKIIPSRRFTVIVLGNSGELPWNVVRLTQELFAGPEASGPP